MNKNSNGNSFLLLNKLVAALARHRAWLFHRRSQECLQAVDLVERLKRGLPAPLPVLSRHSEEVFQTTAVLLLAAQYDELRHSPAWVDFVARLATFREQTQNAILEGRWSPTGEDQTPYLRVCLGLLDEILAIPGRVQEQAKSVEEKDLGIQA